MDRKNMALILSIFLFVGLLFSVDPLERERDYNYGETHQIYSAGAGLTSGVSAIKTVRRIQTPLIYCLFLTWGMLYAKTEKWIELYLKRMEMLYFLKQVRVSQRMDGKKRKEQLYATQ